MKPATNERETAGGGRDAQCKVVRHLQELAVEVAALKAVSPDAVTDTLAHWLAAQYAVVARERADDAGRAGLPLQTLRQLTEDVVALRRGDHSASRLVLEREWLEVERGKTSEAMERQFEEWMNDPSKQKRRKDAGRLTQEERAERIREVFGMPRPEKPGLSAETLAEIERAAKIL